MHHARLQHVEQLVCVCVQDAIYYGEAPKQAAARKEKWKRMVIAHEPDEVTMPLHA